MSEPIPNDNSNREIIRSAFNGWFMLVLNLVLFFGGIALFIHASCHAALVGSVSIGSLSLGRAADTGRYPDGRLLHSSA